MPQPIILRNANRKILYILKNITEAGLVEKVGNLSYLNFTAIRELPPFFIEDDILNAEYVEIHDERLNKKRHYKITTIERDHGSKFVENFECVSVNYAKYQNKYVRVTLSQRGPLSLLDYKTFCLGTVFTTLEMNYKLSSRIPQRDWQKKKNIMMSLSSKFWRSYKPFSSGICISPMMGKLIILRLLVRKSMLVICIKEIIKV